MEKKDLGNKLIIIGLFLYLSYIVLFGLVDYYWNINYFYIIDGNSAIMKNITILGYVIVAIINTIAIITIIIGGRWAKLRIDYWLVLIGIIHLMNSLSTGWLVTMANLLGMSLPTHYEVLFPITLITLIGTGIVFVITGGLMKNNK